MTKPLKLDDFPVSPSLDFLQKIWGLNHAVEKLSSRMEKKLGITAQQRVVIRCIGTYPGITAGQLAGVLHIDPGTMSTALRRLEERKLIERRRDPSDSRKNSLALTAWGREFDSPTEGTVEKAVEQMLATSTPHELATTRAVLERLTSFLDAMLEQ